MSIRSGALKHVGDGALSDSDDELEEQGVVGGIDDDSDDENVFQESNQSDRGSIHGPGHHGEVSSTFRSSVSPSLGSGGTQTFKFIASFIIRVF